MKILRLMGWPSAATVSLTRGGATASCSARLDDHPLGNGCVLYYDDDPVLNDEPQVFPACLHPAVFIYAPYVAPDACVLVDNGSLDRCVCTNAQGYLPALYI